MEFQDNLSRVKNHTGITAMVEDLRNLMPLVISKLTVRVQKISIKKLNNHGFLLVIQLTLLQYLTH